LFSMRGWYIRYLFRIISFCKCHCCFKLHTITSHLNMIIIIKQKKTIGNIIGGTRLRSYQQTQLVKALRRILFSPFVFPLFYMIICSLPIVYQLGLDYFYYKCLKWVLHCNYQDSFFSLFAYDERALNDLCYSYWKKYFKTLTKWFDGRLIQGQSLLNPHRTRWQDRAQKQGGNSGLQDFKTSPDFNS
jgi:hypothetical protein